MYYLDVFICKRREEKGVCRGIEQGTRGEVIGCRLRNKNWGTEGLFILTTDKQDRDRTGSRTGTGNRVQGQVTGRMTRRMSRMNEQYRNGQDRGLLPRVLGK